MMLDRGREERRDWWRAGGGKAAHADMSVCCLDLFGPHTFLVKNNNRFLEGKNPYQHFHYQTSEDIKSLNAE